MGLIKFITVYDDEKSMVMFETVLKRYNISAYPPMFLHNKSPYFDGINSNSVNFIKIKENNFIDSAAIPISVFKEAYRRAYDQGYLAVIVVCPHSKWYPYYKDAVKASNNFKRSKIRNYDYFRIDVIDSKSFASGVMFHALSMSRQYVINHCPSQLVSAYGRKNAVNNQTFILSDCKNAFGNIDGNLTAYRSYGYKFDEISVTNYQDSVKYDVFAQFVSKKIRKSNGRYAVSFGADCYFVGNIIGRVESITGIHPVCSMQYGIASTSVLGNRTICFHLL